jgi:hypothetical protein
MTEVLQAKPLSPETEAAAKNLMTNMALAQIDTFIKSQPPAMQMGILVLACALTFKRLAHVSNWGRGMKLRALRGLVRDFEVRVRQIGFEPVSQVREPESK